MWQQLLVVLLLWPLFTLTLNDERAENQQDGLLWERKSNFPSGFT